MRLEHIGIAAVIVAGGLASGSPWTQTGRIGTLELGALDSRTEAGTDDAGLRRFDPYTQGQRAGRFDPYTDGMGRPGSDLVWLQRNT
ncbi:hypothetical protein [Cupriavidus sp. TMH.W2]|uniref:hypothetical protein n=1 Tax=Cupriavidus sp. TMH.W2 TaxID=3434465 RepID=UPI003D780BD7